MRKSLLLTCLLTLVAAFGMAQETTKFPITLTTADGLPGPKIVQNFVYKSNVYNLEEAVSVLRFTVCSTNTVDSLTEGSYDGYSAGWGSGIPFFTMSEFRIYDGEGNQLEYIANANAIQDGDGGGLAVLNDGLENNHFHSTYSNNGTFPHAWHYVEFELAEPVSSFSFSWNTRSGYYKNLITYMGITPGTDYLPFPEQEFQIVEQATTLEDIAEEGALFVLRSNAPEDYYYDPEGRNRLVPKQLYYHAPYGATETASAAALVYLTPDLEKENAYKVCWLNNGHYMIKQEYNSGWYHWTNNILKAASVEFAPCDSVDGDFVLSQYDQAYLISHDALGKMSLVSNDAESLGNRARPNTYHWTIFKASINGAAIAAQLQAEIDEAEARIAAIGGEVPGYDEGEYEALTEALAEAKEIVAKADVTAAEILNTKRSLNRLTAAYAAVGLWVYVDSIAVIGEMVDEEEISLCQGPDWENGAYNQEVFDAMQVLSDNIQLVIEKCESLADVDAAIDEIYSAIAAFWASKVEGVKELPFRVGSVDDGLPGTLQSWGGWVWESPMYLLTEEVETIRFTYFKTNNNGKYSGTDYVFPTFGEIEFYDLNGDKIQLTVESFNSNSMMVREDNQTGDWQGYAALIDGKPADTWCHATWGSGQVPSYDENPEYHWLEVTFPEPVSAFKYIQYGRKNGNNTPTDFVIGLADESMTPDDIDHADPYNSKVGEQITDASQITDDGLYALVGLINCAPEGDGSGYEKFYTSSNVYGKKIGAPCAFTITKTGDENGTFYIRSLADSKYWSRTIDDDGWGSSNTTASSIEDAGKFFIVPNAEARATAGKEEFPNTFAIYQYNDTVKRSNDKIDSTGALVPHPYIVVQDWGSYTGFFSIPDLTYNDFDGEGEWYIYKMTMDNPYIYWLKSVYAAASANALQVGIDPGYYSEASVGGYAKALAKAQSALEANDNAAAKEALIALETASNDAAAAELNPMVPGNYVIESSYAAYFAQQGVTKALCSYYNDYEDGGADSEYSLWWTDGPTDLENPAIYYQFKFESAANSEQVQIWLEDSVITADEAANAYYIKSVEVGQYVGTASSLDDSGIPNRSKDIGLTAEPVYPYIVRAQGAYKFNLWCPVGPNNCLHMEGHSSGAGKVGDIVHWNGGSVDASCWTLRSIDARTSIGNLTVEPEGDVVSTSYYTVAGAAVPAPVKGINIVKKVYANGAVESSKIYVK